MNLILFSSEEICQPLPKESPRARHIRQVLQRKTGDAFDCGLVDGPRGKATIVRDDDEGLHLYFTWGESPPPLDALSLLIGIPRPQTARKILLEATTLGVERMIFFRAERAEPSYANSTIWRNDALRRLLIAGAEQAFCTRLPQVVVAGDLAAASAHFRAATTRIALDNYEATGPLSRVPPTSLPAVLAVGAERGWSPRERDFLRDHGFTLAHLGWRVLRTETATVAGLALLRAHFGLL